MTREKLGLHQLSLRTIITYASDAYETYRQGAINIRQSIRIKDKYFCPRKDDSGELHGNKSVCKEGNTAYCAAVDERGRKCFYTFIGTGIKR